MNSLSLAIPTPGMALFPGLCNGPVKSRKASAAGDIQNTLAPLINYRDPGLEAYGRTIPKDEVGGDLVDLVAAGGDVVAYVADVSGHGLGAGFLAGMIKAAVRYGLHLGNCLPHLLDDINSVLPAVKQSNMFATFAALRFDGSSEVEYISAGHVPLLHYRQRFHDVVRHSMPQFPLGLFESDGYVSSRIRYEAGDIFGLVTDGVVEAGIGWDAEFGLEGVAQSLCDIAGRPLAEALDRVQAAVTGHTGHGMAHDDRTVLLVRAIR